MSGPGPKSQGVEAAVELGGCVGVGFRRFGGALVEGFGLVEVPLLLVGEEFEEDEAEDDFGEDLVVCG